MNPQDQTPPATDGDQGMPPAGGDTGDGQMPQTNPGMGGDNGAGAPTPGDQGGMPPAGDGGATPPASGDNVVGDQGAGSGQA
ncbi:MAG TPA: hypothetical protein VFB59_01840 [Candidatus Saccharimonadales bacterium]|nr:hypothetical protein [Candidatus Saccharimonadales bacterium]